MSNKVNLKSKYYTNTTKAATIAIILLVFVFTIIKISLRSNLECLNKSLDKIVSIDVL